MVNLNKIREIVPAIGGASQLTLSNVGQVKVSRRQSIRLLLQVLK
jgi:DNA-binding LytR/AlgR family response regulator